MCVSEREWCGSDPSLGLNFRRVPWLPYGSGEELGRSLSQSITWLPAPVPHLYRLRSVNQSWTTITTWQTVKRKAAI